MKRWKLVISALMLVITPYLFATEIKVMTYNVNLLPNIPTPLTTNLNKPYQRAYYIPKEIAKHNIDVVALQEAIAPISFYILDKRMKAFGYKYRTNVVGQPNLEHLNLLNGGVIIYSRYPIVGQPQYVVFPRSYGLEGISNKGAVFVAIEKDHQIYHLISLHAQSFSGTIDDNEFNVWKKQMGALQEAISNQHFSSNDKVILMGDFNADSGYSSTTEPTTGNIVYQTLLNMLHLKASAPFAQNTLPFSYDKLTNSMAVSDERTTLDHILCIDGATCPSDTQSSVEIVALKNKHLGDMPDLSDHYAMIGTLVYP